MKDSKVKTFKDESGSALILAMMILVSGILIFSSITSVSLMQRSASSKMRSSTEAFQIADSCLEWTLMNYYKLDGTDPVSDMGSFAGDVFTPDFLEGNLSGVMLDVGGEKYPVGDCKVYLLNEDGAKIISDATLLKDVREVQSIGRAGFGKDVTRRAVQVGLDSCGQDVDIDGDLYPTVKIGTQCWMAKNLNVGDPVCTESGNEDGDGNNLTCDKDMSSGGDTEKYCYENKSSNCDEYGGLYQWDEAMEYPTSDDAQGICPEGWHIPTDGEWHVLETFLVDDPDPSACPDDYEDAVWSCLDAGIKLKEAGEIHWTSGNNGDNESGFSAFGGGGRLSGGTFANFKNNGNFWSSTEVDSSKAWRRALSYNQPGVNRNDDAKTNGRSVRCIRD